MKRVTLSVRRVRGCIGFVTSSKYRTTKCIIGALLVFQVILFAFTLHLYMNSEWVFSYLVAWNRQIKCLSWINNPMLSTSDSTPSSTIQDPTLSLVEQRTRHCKQLPYYSQILRDLAPYRFPHKITPELIDRMVRDAPVRGSVLRLKIYKGEIYEVGSPEEIPIYIDRRSWIIDMLQKTLCHFGDRVRKTISVELVFCLFDESNLPIDTEDIPVFTLQKKDTQSSILFPASTFYLNWDSTIAEMRSAHQNFDTKISKVVWRGSQTGGWFTKDTWKSFPRSKIVLFSKEQPALCDAGFSSFSGQVDGEETKKDITETTGGFASYISLKDMQRYKYIAIIDGNGWVVRYSPLLAGGSSVLFKQASPWIEHYYSALMPYRHYVPISRDLSDLEYITKWANENDLTMKRIVSEMRKFVDENLRSEHLYCYIIELLIQYQTVLDFSVTVPDEFLRDNSRIYSIVTKGEGKHRKWPCTCENRIS